MSLSDFIYAYVFIIAFMISSGIIGKGLSARLAQIVGSRIVSLLNSLL